MEIFLSSCQLAVMIGGVDKAAFLEFINLAGLRINRSARAGIVSIDSLPAGHRRDFDACFFLLKTLHGRGRAHGQ